MQAIFTPGTLEFGSSSFVLSLHMYDTIRVILQLANAKHVGLQGMSFGWLVGLIFHLGWIED
jgi:hypothetical protein